MKIEWRRYTGGPNKGEIFGANIWGRHDECPVAIISFGNGGTSSHRFIRIEAISGILEKPQSTCHTCVKEGAHGLVRGPVDRLTYTKSPIFRGGTDIRFPTFSLEEMKNIIEKEFGIKAKLPKS